LFVTSIASSAIIEAAGDIHTLKFELQNLKKNRFGERYEHFFLCYVNRQFIQLSFFLI